MLELFKRAPFELHRLDRASYHQLAEAGAFEGARVELIDGVVITKNRARTTKRVAARTPRPATRAANVVVRLNELLLPQVIGRGTLRPALPLALSSHSEPEPDFAIVAPDAANPDEHPRVAPLVIEVADSSRSYDLGLKARLYAAARIPEYWVVDLETEKLVVHLEPKKGVYQRIHRHGRRARVTSSLPPEVTLEVAALFR